ncbi:unnamed protein product [Meganyctiphanes norvegica]|uniref:MBD domain-containing protein n=1 Tax=Meganyctiphanes norvegica TaxID=48144 RepID=A0AAV2SAF1_MEGNR
MNEMGSGENFNDEFECSECDFKCKNEIDMLHSAIHQCSNNTIEDVLHFGTCSTFIEDDSKEDYSVVNLQTKFSSQKETVSCNRLTDTPEMNDIGAYDYRVKIGTNLCEGISKTEMHHESEIENKRIKLEDIDIKEEIFPNYDNHQIDEYVNIHQDQDSLESMPYKIRHSIHSAPNNVNISTEDANLSDKTIAENYGSSSCQSEPSHDLSLPIDSQGLTCYKRPNIHRSNTEVEIDNTGIYIPHGWNRKVYLRTTLCNGIVRPKYYCFYYTETGKKLHSMKGAYEYADKKYLPDVDIAKLNFSPKNNMKKVKKASEIEVKINNTGKYIPEGWQRKLYKFTNGVNEDWYVVRYVSPLGKSFCSKTQVLDYVEKFQLFESNGIMELINVNKMDFSSKITQRITTLEPELEKKNSFLGTFLNFLQNNAKVV